MAEGSDVRPIIEATVKTEETGRPKFGPETGNDEDPSTPAEAITPGRARANGVLGATRRMTDAAASPHDDQPLN